MRSAYAIRLYQFAKRWEFKRKYLVSVAELRGIMGALHPAGRGKTKTALGNYADFKRRAVQTAVDEINAKSDIFLSFTEVKARGSKAVESLDFTIAPRTNPTGIETLALPVAPQMELELENERDAIEEDRAILTIKARYALSEKQAGTVRGYYRKKGAEYVSEKTAIVDQEKRANVARALLAALRDDWQPSRRTAAARQKAADAAQPGETSGKFAEIKSVVSRSGGSA